MRIHLHTRAPAPCWLRSPAASALAAARCRQRLRGLPGGREPQVPSATSQSLVVRITEPNGVHRDVTDEAKFTLADPVKAKIEKGVVYPVADGETTLKVE